MIGLDEWAQQSEAPKMASPKDVADACEVLIQHVLSMGCDSAVINVGSTEGGSALISVRVIDCDGQSDTQKGSTQT
jgi:hypothetical protein